MENKEETTMERKIGEIFEYNGEWYQCIEGAWCLKCDFHRPNLGATQCNYYPHCMASKRSDHESVVFKKLEKVGEPFSDYCPSGRVIYFQGYKCYQKPIYTGNMIYLADDTTISIEIKENMEEKKLNLKPFDLEAAKAGKPVCTRDGRKARIICFDAKGPRPIVALVDDGYFDEEPIICHSDGSFNYSEIPSDNDLMMLPVKKEGWVNVCKSDLYQDKEIALHDVKQLQLRDYIDTIKIEWEE